jgi:hypothetical protein
MSKADPVALLQDPLNVLSRAETERAWTVGDAATRALGNANIALRAEVAAHMLATILDDIGKTTRRPDSLSDVLPAVESLALYVCGRMATIVSEFASRQHGDTEPRLH